MNVVLGVLLIAAIVGGWLLIRHAMGAAERAIRRSSFDRGTELTTRALTFTMPLPPGDALAALRSALRPAAERPTLVGALYVAEATEDHLLLRWGSTLETEYGYLIRVAPAPTGTRGVLVLAEWHYGTYSKIVTGLDSLTAVRDQVTATVRHIGGEWGNVPTADVASFLGESPVPAPPAVRTPVAPPAEPSAPAAAPVSPEPPSTATLAACPRCAVPLHGGHRDCPRCGAPLATCPGGGDGR